jgi:hypothetical protein
MSDSISIRLSRKIPWQTMDAEEHKKCKQEACGGGNVGMFLRRHCKNQVAPIKPPLNLSARSPIYLNIFVLDKIER